MSVLAEYFRSGFCGIDLLALVVLVGVIVFFAVCLHRLHIRETELRDQISEEFTDDIIRK